MMCIQCGRLVTLGVWPNAARRDEMVCWPCWIELEDGEFEVVRDHGGEEE